MRDAAAPPSVLAQHLPACFSILDCFSRSTLHLRHETCEGFIRISTFLFAQTRFRLDRVDLLQQLATLRAAMATVSMDDIDVRMAHSAFRINFV